MSVDPIAALRGLTPYQVGKTAWPIDLPLHGNEGPPPPPELWQALADPDLIRRYPSATRLEASLAERLGLAPAQVLVTAGADEALDRAFRSFVGPGDEVVLPSPTFAMLPHYARLAGATARTPAWPAEDFPADATLAAIGARTRAVALVSPNNPTGALIPKDVLVRIARAAPDVAMLVDFAYVETADDDPTRDVLACENALVFRTLSKVWGLAGLRVGYVCGAERLIRVMRAAGGPFSVSAPSLALATAHLASGEARMRAYVASVRAERDALYDALAAAGTAPMRSHANFVFTRLGSAARAVAFRDGLAERGIGIRIFPAEDGIQDGARITCPGDSGQLARLLGAIGAVCGEERTR